MIDPLFSNAITNALESRFPAQAKSPNWMKLHELWSNTLAQIISRFEHDFWGEAETIHVDLKPEMAITIAACTTEIATNLVTARTANRDLGDICPTEEASFQASDAGQALIEGTAKVLTTSWLERYHVRWKPKTDRKLGNEKNPPPLKARTPKKVNDNHFIPKSHLRRFWSSDQKLTVYTRRSVKDWGVQERPFGNWGYQSGLYSDPLEDRFSLIEGDATDPINKVLDVYPLNDPERAALMGFFIVQKMRNPYYRKILIEGVLPVSVREVGDEKAKSPEFQRDVYETIFQNNDLYRAVARPLHWSRWAVLRSESPEFVIPDTCCILTKIDNLSWFMYPLNPNACFVATGMPETEKRAVPIELKGEELAQAATGALIQSSVSEFVSRGPVELSQFDWSTNYLQKLVHLARAAV
ncbi:DUF4238 domain-containing protein [Pseudophaeobacter sp. EL27]|uniref:DUF4238 domain-containing protein n=1 Tax=Pseudophaeobacter sp. EL27 TaxID=2107580 RepID=UPI000EFCD9F3|nr:DUF4238 domain-containing protein [Pseudophaeobacter sp. EL27]